MKKKKKKLIFFIIILIAAVLVYMSLNLNNKGSDKPIKKVVDEIEKFDYTVSETDTKLFKDEFKKLKKELSKKKIDNKEYATIVAKLFIIDFFTLDNKLSKNDVGGIQFVYSEYKTSFIDKARDEFYRYVKSNLDNNRDQKLPIVKEIKVTSCEEITTSSELSGEQFSSIDEAYKISLNWKYKEDLGYQSSGNVIVIKDNEKFSVAKLYE